MKKSIAQAGYIPEAKTVSDFVLFLASNLSFAEFEEQIKNKYGSGRSVYVVLREEKPENYVSRSIKNFLVTDGTTKIMDAFWLGLHGKWREVLSNG